jgi:gamma-glutamyl:cysteine ligase YbdK (ATP-grasp superfamily)
MNLGMSAAKRVQVMVSLDERLHRAIQRKAKKAHKSASAVMSEAVQRALRQEATERQVVREARRQTPRSYEEFEAELVRAGLL